MDALTPAGPSWNDTPTKFGRPPLGTRTVGKPIQTATKGRPSNNIRYRKEIKETKEKKTERVGIDEKNNAVDDTHTCASSDHLEYFSRLIMSLPLKYTFLRGYAKTHSLWRPGQSGGYKDEQAQKHFETD